jgi:uncharacterized membrane protein YfcA
MITKPASLRPHGWILMAGATATALFLMWPPVDTANHNGTQALLMLAIFLSAAVSNIAGFAFSAIAGASVLHLIEDPVKAVEVLIISSIAIQSYSVLMLWRDIDWRSVTPFLLGGILTIPVGIYLLLHASLVIYCHGMGLFLVIYAGFMIFRPSLKAISGNVLIDAGIGALGGITGGAAGFPGAFATIWCGLRGWDKSRQRAVYQPYILAMQLFALFGLELAGHVKTYDLSMMTYVPAALLGAYCGLAIFRRLGDAHFNVVINALLMISGVALFLK